MLLPTTPGFTMTGFEPVTPMPMDPKAAAGQSGEVRHGRRGGAPDVRQLGGYFVYDSPDAELLVSLLPALIHVRDRERLATLVRLISEESRERRGGRELVLTRLVEVLLIEALRATPGDSAPPGLLRGLADPRVAYGDPTDAHRSSRQWTVVELARKTALSRSSFFDRFTKAVGVAPMEYLLAWRMAMAKGLLRQQELGIEAICRARRLWRQRARSAPRSAGMSGNPRLAMRSNGPKVLLRVAYVLLDSVERQFQSHAIRNS